MPITTATAIRGSISVPLVLTSSFVNATVADIGNATGLTLACKYTRATDVPGVPRARFEWSTDNTNWFGDPTLDTVIVDVDPYASQQQYITDLPLPVPADNTAIMFLTSPIRVPPGAQFFRASFRDAGGTPGTLGVEVWPGRA